MPPIYIGHEYRRYETLLLEVLSATTSTGPLPTPTSPSTNLQDRVSYLAGLCADGTATPIDHGKSNGKSPVPLNLAISLITNQNDGNNYDEDDLDLAEQIEIKKDTANIELNNSIQNTLLKEINEDGTIGTFRTSRPVRVLATAFILD